MNGYTRFRRNKHVVAKGRILQPFTEEGLGRTSLGLNESLRILMKLS